MNKKKLNLLKIWLLNGMYIELFYKLQEAFGNIENILTADRKEFQRLGNFKKNSIDSIINSRKDIDRRVEEELNLIEKNNIKLISIDSKSYPQNLKNVYDPPPFLYIRGDLKQVDNFSIAIVGPRKATSYGLMIAKKFAKELAAHNITVISGLARGIDTAAHVGALEGGRTLAVLGNGLDTIYPYENRVLADHISRRGAIISEFPMTSPPLKFHFPMRNRIVSGISLGVLIIEATERSGALITARCALEQNREVFAVPGNITSPKSKGSNILLKEGAKIVTEIEDILEEFEEFEKLLKIQKATQSNKVINKELENQEKIIYDIIKQEDKVYIDNIKIQSKYSINQVLNILAILELKGYIKKIPGNYYCQN